MKYKIIRNKEYLHRKTEPVLSIEEGLKISEQLIAALNEYKIGIGLSAIQIGIPKAVSIIRVRRDRPDIILMNPVITEHSKDKLIYLEGCLSIPGKQVPTNRSVKVTVVTLNHANPLSFGPDVEPLTQESVPLDYGLLESVCVQHEIDHTLGVIITDESVRFSQIIKKSIKHGRNDKVVVEKNGETQYIKYKKALELISNGWKII